jgi:diguanylate cyclase (GGDEF)-like protein
MSHRPPLSSFTSKHFAALVDRSRVLGPTRSWRYTYMAMLLVILLDYLTGPRLSLGVLYMLVACFAAWNLREKAGFIVAATAILTQTLLNGPGFPGSPQSIAVTPFAAVWNTASRAIIYGMLVTVIGGLRYALELERWRASTDGLTGALNKAAFREAMGRAIARAQRSDAAIVLAYMDLDGFKGVNDYNGHSAGDLVLRSFASEATRSIRPDDLFARIGGDEFIALLTVPNCDQGDKTAEILHARLTGILRGTGFDVTCSMGALVVASRELDADDRVIETADKLMYEVKRNGKNGLRIARADPMRSALRIAFPLSGDDSFAEVLGRLDQAERAWVERPAA